MAIAFVILALSVLALAMFALHAISSLDECITKVEINNINACRRLDERIDTVLHIVNTPPIKKKK